jgi:hypothetical protein
MTMPERRVSPEEIDQFKRWAMMKFREILRGARVTEQIRRWASGEMGPEYRFRVDIALNEEARTFIENPENKARLEKELLA